MSKKKLSQKKTGNKQLVSRSIEIKEAPKGRIIIVFLGFLGLKLAETVFDAIFEQPVKNLLSVVVNWIKSILA
jgi:hypothetical protein